MTTNAFNEKNEYFVHDYENVSKQVREMTINSSSDSNDN
jgi:hypothetical protein